MSGLTPLLTSGYENISHGFVCAMIERWHEETSIFHLPVGEMTIPLDDVACLLGIPITRRLLPDREFTREEGLEMMQMDLLFTEEAAAKEMTKQGAAHVSFGVLKRCYEELLNRCNQLLVNDTQKEQDERAEVRLACIKAFLLLLLGWTIFSGKNSKNINHLWLLAMQDMDELDSWSWGGMRLAFLYEHLSLTSDSTLAHFSNIIPRIDDDAYDPAVSPLVSEWKSSRGFSNPGHYRAIIDSLDHSHVTWRPYERRRHITPFQDIC